MGSNTRIAKALEEMPTHSGVVEGVAAELENSIGVGRKHRSETLLGGTSQFARVVEAAVDGVIGFLISGGLGVGQTVEFGDVTEAGSGQGP